MLRHSKVFLISLVALALTIPVCFGQEVGSHARMVRISYLEGTVHLNGQRPSANSPITEGAVLVTGSDGLAEVQFEDASVIRMASQTQITFAQLARLTSGEPITRADLDQGEAEFLVPASSAGHFAVDVLGKNILLKEPGRFRILSTNSSPLEIAIWKGEATVRDHESGKEVTVKKNETFTLNPADPQQYDLESAVVADDLDHWSEVRDQVVTSAYTSTYTSPTTNVYNYPYSGGGYYQPVYGFGYYGFSSCPSFGFGWQPFWFGGSPWDCWNSGFFSPIGFFPPPTFFVVTPVVVTPVRPHRPPFIRPPTVPTVAKAGPVPAAIPGIQRLRFGGHVQRSFNDDNFTRSVPRVGSAQPPQTLNDRAKETGQGPATSRPVAPAIAPGQRSAGNAPAVAPAHAPPAMAPAQAPHMSAPSAPPPRPSAPAPPRSFSPPPSSGPHGFSGGSMSHPSASAAHSGGRSR